MKNIIYRIRQKLATKFSGGSFARNVLVMFVGTALGQFTSVLLSPLLTRIYSPEFFGILGFFTAIVGTLSVVASLSYEMALTLAKDKDDAANLLTVCILSLLLTTALFYGFLLFSPDSLLDRLFGALVPYLYLMPIGFFCIGAYAVMVNFATLKAAFPIIARTKIYQGVIGPVSQIGLGLAGAGAWGLIVGFILGQSAGVINMFTRLVLKPRDVFGNVTWRGITGVARRFIRFPLLSTWSSIISVLGSNSMIMVVIPLLYSNVIAGYIFLTERIIGRPLLLISTSILQVYIGEASKTQNSDPRALRKRFLQIVKGQFVIVSSWLILINATAFYFVPIVFGKEWAEAVIYINILSIYYLPQMVMTSVRHTLQIMEKQGMMAMWDIARCVVIVSGFVASYVFFLSSVQSVLIYSISQAAMQIILFRLIYSAIQKLQPTEPRDS